MSGARRSEIHLARVRLAQSRPPPKCEELPDVKFQFICLIDVLENPYLKSFTACLRLTSYGITHKHTTYHFEWKNEEKIQKKSKVQDCVHIFISERRNYSSHKPPRLTEKYISSTNQRAKSFPTGDTTETLSSEQWFLYSECVVNRRYFRSYRVNNSVLILNFIFIIVHFILCVCESG